MKFLFLFCIYITLVVALPQRGIYKNYRRKIVRQSEQTEANVTTIATSTSSTTESSVEEGQTEAVVAAVAQDIVSEEPQIVSSSTPENKPIAEPTRTPAPLLPVEPTTTSPAQNETRPEEEDDSSSEEDAEDSEGRQITITKLEVPVLPVEKSNKKPRDTKPIATAASPQLGGVVRGYLSETGELLVPISAFPPNFRYSVIHDDAVPSSSEEAGDVVEDTEAQSEEVSSANAGSRPVGFEPAGANETETEVASVSESAKPESSSVEETEDKSTEAESKEKPSVEAAPPKETPVSVFNPPPLAALPATKPTDEDDEEAEFLSRAELLPAPAYFYNPYNFNPYYYGDYDF